jgi:hypothetical protein
MITRDTLEKRKVELSEDMNRIRLLLEEYDRKKTEDTALLNGLSGALQQCDIFLKELDNDESEMAGDVENSPETD